MSEDLKEFQAKMQTTLEWNSSPTIENLKSLSEKLGYPLQDIPTPVDTNAVFMHLVSILAVKISTVESEVKYLRRQLRRIG